MTIYECLKVSDNIFISLPICTCIFPYSDNVRVLEKNEMSIVSVSQNCINNLNLQNEKIQ